MTLSELIDKLQEIQTNNPEANILVRGPSGYLREVHSVQKSEILPSNDFAIEAIANGFGIIV